MSSFNGQVGPLIVSDGLYGCWDVASKGSWNGEAPSVSNNIWRDRTFHNNDATLINVPTFVNQNAGFLRFNGTDEYATCTNTSTDTNITNPAAGSVSAWFRRSGGSGYQGVVASQFRWGFLIDGNDLHLYNWGSGGSIGSGYTITNDVWYNAVGTWIPSGGSNTSKLYINGVLEDQGQIVYASDAAQPLQIAESTPASPSQWFEGDIACVHFYTRVLTPSEIKSNYSVLKRRFT